MSDWLHRDGEPGPQGFVSWFLREKYKKLYKNDTIKERAPSPKIYPFMYKVVYLRLFATIITQVDNIFMY